MDGQVRLLNIYNDGSGEGARGAETGWVTRL